ncbi:aminoacyl tRNA synthase complex-interacting multifunctional protein 1-like [Sitodiplosis mosellana]|uniref:aminoacyl tRNA synthase complex-interacting multifunctional protein 1-like n=1 Tax=Sitodiplosis mosellana TaxID=263140 RepID=UPI002443EF14|nr:aminoacyl tRNA synthase complex-interacting multifunctional protein 1-like [Sitodiplosis mosellana]
MMQVTFTRNLVRLAKPSLANQFERQFSQLRVLTPLVSSLDRFLKPTTTTTVMRDFCSEQSKKKKQKKNPPAVEHVGRLDFRIGTIVEVNKAPDADTLYLTKIDIGGEFLSVVAGLAKFLTVDELIGRNVVVLCNLKPSKLRGHLSEGMIMCAKSGDKMEVLEPPANAKPGDLVYCESYERTIPDGGRDKKKLYDPLAPDMATNDQLVACYKGSYLYVPDKGNIVTKSLKNANIT